MSDNNDELLKDAIVWITGARGVGKSTLAWTYYDPRQELLSRVFGHDAERSANRIRQQIQSAGLDFGYYGDLGARFSDLPATDDLLHRISTGKLPWVDSKEKTALRGYYEHVLEDLDKHLARGKFDVYVHDPIEPFEGGMAAWCEDKIKMFGYSTIGQAMKFGRFWSDVVYTTYRQFFSSIFDRGVKVINLVSHLKTPWQDNQPVPGKVVPGGKPLLHLLSSLVLWLENEPANLDGAPVGLVLKERLGKLEVVDGKWVSRRMIPQRIPHCTWNDIKGFMVDGCDLADPKLQMKLSERQMISELLSNEQMRLMILSAEERLQNGHSDSEHSGDQVQSVASTFSIPTPEYKTARSRADELLGKNITVTEAALLEAFIPPVQGSVIVKAAIQKVLGEI